MVLAGALAAGASVEAFVIHATSVAVPREHRRAKTDRLDTGHLKSRSRRALAEPARWPMRCP